MKSYLKANNLEPFAPQSFNQVGQEKQIADNYGNENQTILASTQPKPPQILAFGDLLQLVEITCNKPVDNKF